MKKYQCKVCNCTYIYPSQKMKRLRRYLEETAKSASDNSWYCPLCDRDREKLDCEKLSVA